MKFSYQARAKGGDIQSGIVEAFNREAALALLQKYGLFITSLEEVRARPVYAREIKLFRGISGKDKAVFSRQLSIMFKSKVALTEALRVMVTQTENPNFREKILKIAEDVEAGASLSKALSRFPEVFSSFFIGMIKSGETAGKLSDALEYLADHLERENDFQSKVQGAMIYPIMVITVMLGVILLMVFFVFPQIAQIVEELGVEPPLITKIVFGAVNFFKKWLIVIVLTLITLVLFIYQYLKTKEGRTLWNRTSLQIPVMRDLLKKIYLSRFAENLSTLISGGVQIAPALETAGEAVGNEVYKVIIIEARDAVRRGDQINSVLRKYPENFPPLFTQMTLIGEKTGTLEETLMHLVSFYQKEVSRALENVLNLLVPFTIVILGIVVGGMVGSVILTLYNVVGTM
jgi:type IV pilus assembly protein PilC